MKSKVIFRLLMCIIGLAAMSCKKEKIRNVIAETRGGEQRGLPNVSTCTYCDELNPIGGGTGYANIVTSGNVTITSHSGGVPKTPTALGIELTNAVNAAVSGQTIFLQGACDVLVTSTITIDEDITIASDRGNGSSPGAHILYSPSSETSAPLFNIVEDGVRITGLRMEGHEYNAMGIIADQYVDITIDNNEFYDWMVAMKLNELDVTLATDGITNLTENAYFIHHNYIHHNIYGYSPGGSVLGYGILLDNAFMQIYANQFEVNRHDFAAVGWAKSGFNMYCNIFGDAAVINGTRQNNIDIHGADGFAVNYAGGFMHIHHNDFLYINSTSANIYPVGKPTVLMLIDNNKFTTPTCYYDVNSAIMQRPYLDTGNNQTNTEDAYGNIFAVNNTYNNSYLGWYARETWSTGATDNFVRIPSTNDLLHSNLNMVSGDFTSSWINLDGHDLDYYLGDFNGDGQTDIFKTDNGNWYYMPLNTDYANSWTSLNSSAEPIGEMDLIGVSGSTYKFLPNLVLDNWNSDATTDIYLSSGGTWYVSYSGTTAWTYLNSSGYTPANTLFGKFNKAGYSDMIMDVFKKDGSNWYISYDGVSAWTVTTAGTQTWAFSDLRLGDFSGDGKDDVFRKSGTSPYTSTYSSHGATSTWTSIVNQSLDLDKTVIGDFYGNSCSDIISSISGTWKLYVTGGGGSFQTLNTTNFPLSGLPFGDLD